MSEKPNFYILGTPIGNLEDISLRALRILGEVDYILSEDTRTTVRLLQKYKIQTKLKSYRQHQKNLDLMWLLNNLSKGKNIAFTSEAGTPNVSDPGADPVRLIREKNIANIIPIPGPSALATVLSVSGWQTNPSLFLGFLSPRRGKRKKRLEEVNLFEGIIILYESVHRVYKLLENIKLIIQNRDVLIAREMTKMYEEFLFLEAKNQETWLEDFSQLKQKGEFTILLGPITNTKQKNSIGG